MIIFKKEEEVMTTLTNEPMEEPGEKVVRLPVKQKHQLLFKETMQLNMEVRKLRKQVHKMQERMKKYK